MVQGKIKFFDSEKAYGFIVPDEGGNDVFIGMTELEKSGYGGISKGSTVSYETESNKQGKLKAINIKILG